MNVEEMKTNAETTEKVTAEETTAVETTEQSSPFDEAGQQMEALVNEEAKVCCGKTKKAICSTIALGVTCVTVLAAVGCAAWFWKKWCDAQQ